MENNAVFLVKIEDLVRDIIVQNFVPFYRVESMLDAQKNADGTTSVMPVIRIVSYFEDSVNKISNVLLNEFDLNQISEDGQGHSFESASTQQLKYLAGLKANRLELAEYRKWGVTKFEIRICSMLQDALSGMERELTSNGSYPLPDDIKRDLFRVGSLIELADRELYKIKNTVTKRINGDVQPDAAWQAPATARPAVSGTVQMQATPASEKSGIRMDSMDMTVDSFNSLAFSISNVEEKSTNADERFLDLLQNNAPRATVQQQPVVQQQPIVQQQPVQQQPVQQPEPVIPEPIVAKIEEPVVEEPVAHEVMSAPKPAPQSEGMALNIDNIENFNMNVNGMIERTTEIIRESAPIRETEQEERSHIVLDESAQMTDASLKEYVLSSKLLKEIDLMIAERAGAKVNDEIDIEGDVERLKFLKVFNLRQLQERLSENKTDIVAFAEKWIGKDNGGSFDSGISLFYLEYLLVGKKNDPAFAVEYVLKFISDNDYSARYIIPTYNSIRQAEAVPNFAHLTLK